ncbi:MAG: ATP-binding protein, partial [Acidobacteriota bacterium]
MVIGLRERHELEGKLNRAEQSALIGRLASGIAHEVKNPLNYISLTIDYLRGKFPASNADTQEIFFEKMDTIKDEIKRLDRLIRNFLSYGRPPKFTFKPVQLQEIINSLFTLTADQAKQQSIEMYLQQDSGEKTILADAEQLKSCFSNIIINAQQAMPAGGKLNVQIKPEATGVEVTFSDTGSGIAKENVEKIFEPYFSTKDTGTGLGLALVKRIIEGHGGRISVESTIGQGTNFKVWLPCCPPKQVEELPDNIPISDYSPA